MLDPEVINKLKPLTNPEKIEFFLKSGPFLNFKGKFKTPYLSTMYSHFGVESGTIRGRRSLSNQRPKKKQTENLEKPTPKKTKLMKKEEEQDKPP